MYLDYMTYQEFRMKQLELHLNQDSTFKIMLMLCFSETEGYDECLVIN